MSVSTSGVSGTTDIYGTYGTTATQKTDTAASTATEESKAAESTAAESGVVYEKSTDTDSSKAPYTINKMSAEDRAALVSQMQADQESRQQQLLNIVQKMFSQQATTYGQATDIWGFLAKGDYTVDAQTKAQAQEDISEDGYWGVTQTSQRLFDFASALAGDDVDKMKEMQEAMQKGFEQATKSWGDTLPSISQDTLTAANKLFEDYYASKNSDTTTATAEAQV
jgi:negative regulator of replication initiation